MIGNRLIAESNKGSWRVFELFRQSEDKFIHKLKDDYTLGNI